MVAALLVAAVILSHNLMAMVGFGLLLAWAIWRLIESWPMTRSKAMLLGPLLLGVGLSAFFWLPVALEQGAVNLSTLIGEGDHFDFRTHFLSLSTLLGMAPRLDWGASEAHFVFNLGLAQWLLGLLGVIILLTARIAHGRHLAFFAVAAAGLVFMMLPLSTWLWELVPLLPFMQFPWRLLGVTVIMLAVLAGAGIAGLSQLVPKWWQNKLAAAAVGLTLLLGLPLSEVPPWPADFGPTDRSRVVAIELAGHWLGTTSTGDFVPATVESLPRPEGEMIRALREQRPLDRVNRATLPPGAVVTGLEKRPLHFQYQVNSDEAFLLRLFLFDFPGWTVHLDGQVVETEVGRPEGFIVIPVPAGQHLVDVRFESTTARRLAAAVSWLALALMVVGAWRLGGWREGEIWSGGDREKGNWVVVGVVAVITAVYILILAPTGWLRYESEGFVVLPAQTTVFADFDDQIVLIGYDLSADSARPGEEMMVTLYWKAKQAPLPINYQVFVHLLAADGRLVAQSDKLNPGEFPTRRWNTDKYVRDQHQITLPDDLPPGQYTLSTGLWVKFEGWRLPLVDESGQQLDDHYRLPTLFTVR